jgi:hypothetical protein
MKVALEKTFPMPGDVATVWGTLQNIEGVAGCMPGAKITERIDDTHFKGAVSVKVGPASMSFKGDIEVRELDVSKHTLRLIGKGSDSSGTSGASMDLTARVEAGTEAGSSNLIGISEVTMSGKAAAFGGRMMGSVADQILKQFAGNFAKKVAAAAQVAPGATASPAPAQVAPGAAASLAPAQVAPGAAASPAPIEAPPAPVPTSPVLAQAPAPALSEVATPAARPTLTVVSPPPTPAPTPASATASPTMRYAPNNLEPEAEEPANQINALALFWAILRDWFRNLFRRKPA